MRGDSGGSAQGDGAAEFTDCAVGESIAPVTNGYGQFLTHFTHSSVAIGIDDLMNGRMGVSENFKCYLLGRSNVTKADAPMPSWFAGEKREFKMEFN